MYRAVTLQLRPAQFRPIQTTWRNQPAQIHWTSASRISRIYAEIYPASRSGSMYSCCHRSQRHQKSTYRNHFQIQKRTSRNQICLCMQLQVQNPQPENPHSAIITPKVQLDARRSSAYISTVHITCCSTSFINPFLAESANIKVNTSHLLLFNPQCDHIQSSIIDLYPSSIPSAPVRLMSIPSFHVGTFQFPDTLDKTSLHAVSNLQLNMLSRIHIPSFQFRCSTLTQLPILIQNLHRGSHISAWYLSFLFVSGYLYGGAIAWVSHC